MSFFLATPRGRGLALSLLLASGVAGLWFWSGNPFRGTGTGASFMTDAQNQTPVIIYVMDTLRPDRLSAYGYEQPTAPHIEALAAESVLFTHAYAAAGWTLPSVTSMVTSTWPCEHGMVRSYKKLSAKLITLAEDLQTLGYQTYTTYNNPWVGPPTGLTRGYDMEVPRGKEQDNATAEVRRFLDQKRPGPFLLSVHTMEAHHPYYTPMKFVLPFGHVSVDDRELFRNLYGGYRTLKFFDTEHDQPLGTLDQTSSLTSLQDQLSALQGPVRQLYDASIRYADSNLQETIDDLKRRGLWDRSLFILLSDHGEAFGEHGEWFHDQSVYEELTHVMLLIKLPRGEAAGTRISGRVSLVDLKPTILELLGHQERCATCRGKSFLSVIRGQDRPLELPTDTAAVRINDTAYYRPAERARGNLNVAVRQSRWKAIWNSDLGTTELYDLATDPGELRDLNTKEPALAQELRDTAVRWYEQCQARAAPVTAVLPDPRVKAQLKSLGYLQ